MTELPIYTSPKDAPGKALAERARKLRERPESQLLPALDARRLHVAQETLRLTGAADKEPFEGPLLGGQLQALAYAERAAKRVSEPTLDMIHEAHRLANPGATGEFRSLDTPAQFANARPSPARFVESKLDNLLHWLSGESGRSMFTAEKMALWFARFVEIAPFERGNFRTAHLLLNVIAVHDGFPPVSLRYEDAEDIRKEVERAMLFDTGALVARFNEALAESLHACETFEVSSDD